MREMLTVARRTWSLPRCTEAPYPRLWVHPAERGKPDTLSARVPRTEAPKRKCGERGSGERTGRKRRLGGKGRDRGASFAPAERRLTARGCDRTKKTGQTVNRGSG